MAATVSAWAKPGAWALDSEENEAELLQQGKEDLANGGGGANSKSGGDAAALSDFPSLSAAAATKTKKKKPQILSLQEFSTYGSAKPAAAPPQSAGLTHEEIMALPTGPRERSAEELDRSMLGGGFRSYGNSYDRSGREERRPRDSNREFAPSRADETDDWGATKKFTPGNGFDRRERGERGDRGGFFSDSQSRADGSDNWGAKKAFVPSDGRRFDRRGSFDSNGGGDSDNWTANKAFVPSESRRAERRGSFDSNGGGGGDSENWSKKKEEEGWKRPEGGAFDSIRDRRRGNGTDLDNWGRKAEEASVGGGGRPKLNLQPRTLPIAEGQQDGNGAQAKPKGSNPFGSARPREEVLKEKGQDWKEIDQKLESVKIKEAAADGSSFRKKSFGGSNGRSFSPEKSWRKPEADNVRPSSGEDKPVEEAGETGCVRDEPSSQEPEN